MLQETIENGVDLDSARRQARVDLAAAHRLAVMHGFNEGIFNHLTFRVPGAKAIAKPARDLEVHQRL